MERSLKCIKKGLSRVIPLKALSVFEPFEMEMLLYGVPYIDIEDWQINTLYKGAYSSEHKNIKWFWEVLGELSQEELTRLLHFCTGSERLPIHGFK